MMLVRVLGALLILVAGCTPTTQMQTDDLVAFPQDARSIAEQVFSNARFSKHTRTCPADLYQAKSTAITADRAACEANLTKCFQTCLSGSREHCFFVANAFQTLPETRDNPINDTVAYPLYAEGCRLGHKNSCTNAAATARNGREWGKQGAPANLVRDACQRRSYSVDCSDDPNTWGCRMLRRHYPADYAKRF